MSQLKNQLIKLGYHQPELREHIRPVLDTLCRDKKAGKDIYFKQLNPEAQRVLSEEIIEVASQYAAEKGRPLPTPGKALMGFEKGRPYTLEAVREMIKDLEYEQDGFSPFLSKFDEAVDQLKVASLQEGWYVTKRGFEIERVAQRAAYQKSVLGSTIIGIFDRVVVYLDESGWPPLWRKMQFARSLQVTPEELEKQAGRHLQKISKRDVKARLDELSMERWGEPAGEWAHIPSRFRFDMEEAIEE